MSETNSIAMGYGNTIVGSAYFGERAYLFRSNIVLRMRWCYTVFLQ